MALLNHNAVLTTALFYKNFILNISRSTKPAPLFWDLFGITGQFRPFPASWCVLPHPLQNRVPRVQVLLPLPKNRRKHWVFAGFLFSCVARLCGSDTVLSHLFSSVPNRCTPLQHPERTRFRLFLAFPGAFRCFCPLLTCKISGLVFVQPAV